MRNSFDDVLLCGVLLLCALLACCASPGVADGAGALERARHGTSQHNVSQEGLALGGYDPVAYFPEHGGRATKGSEALTAVHRGVTYRFASEANRTAFLEDPAAFEPQYGGWCAWALVGGQGGKVEVDPESFLVENGKLYLFYDGLLADTRRRWSDAGGAQALAPRADANWSRISATQQ